MHEWWEQGEWVNYTSVIEISSSRRHTIGLLLMGVESCHLSNCNCNVIQDPFKKNVSQIFLPTPESLNIYAKLKTLEYEAL